MAGALWPLFKGLGLQGVYILKPTVWPSLCERYEELLHHWKDSTMGAPRRSSGPHGMCQVDEPSIGQDYRQGCSGRDQGFEKGTVSLKKLRGLLSLRESRMHTSLAPDTVSLWAWSWYAGEGEGNLQPQMGMAYGWQWYGGGEVIPQEVLLVLLLLWNILELSVSLRQHC